MAQTASIVTKQFVGLLSDPENGIGPVLSNLAADSGVELAIFEPEQIVNQNIPVNLAERSSAVRYPAIHVYSNRVRNLLTEKFRTFSGKIHIIAEIRVSQDRIENLEDQTRLYADAVTQVLDANRGSWGQGIFFAGAYEVAFDPVQHGGRNLLQIARVAFEVDLSN